MNKLFKFFMFFAIPLLSVLVVSCKDDEDPEELLCPTITSVSPVEGLEGDVVTITGTNLRDVTSVRFGSVNAANFNAANNTATSITVAVPAGLTPGAQNITLTNACGTATGNFTVGEEVLVPTITELNPAEGAPGDVIIIIGTNLEDVTTVRVGDTEVDAFAVEEDGTISFTIPADMAIGETTVTVSSPGGEATFDFVVIESINPAITAFEPAEGAAGTMITVTGMNLDMVTGARIGDVDITDFTAAEDGTSATFTVPEGAVTGPVTLVTEAGDEFESAVEFVVPAGPAITAFDPIEGAIGSEVTVTGTNLNMVTGARIGDVDITDFTAAEDGTSATFTVPEGAVTGPVTLVTEAGDEFPSAEEFTVGPFAFSPVLGPVSTVVTVSGADFTGATAVRLGDMDVTDFVVAEDGSSISFAVPEGATSGVLSVTTPAGELVSTREFTVGPFETAFDEVVSVFGDALDVGWQVGEGWGGTVNELDNADLDNNAIKIVYSEAGAGFQLLPAAEFVLDGDESVILSIYGGIGAGDVWVYLRPADLPADQNVADEDKVLLDVVEGEWRTFVIRVSKFTNNPTTIGELVIQNRDMASNTIYVDNVMVVE